MKALKDSFIAGSTRLLGDVGAGYSPPESPSTIAVARGPGTTIGREAKTMRIFISSGEPSGDLHAANLIRSLKKRLPDAEFVGFGGPRMEEAGATLLYPLVELAVMWFGRVLLLLPRFVRLLNEADRYFERHRPDAAVLIDYPGFHWLLARRAKRRGIPVIYFVPPQLWAWAGWRVKKVRKYIDCVLCSLPFEPDWYRERGVFNAEYAGHPYFDELAERRLDETFLENERRKGGRLGVILPGSRTQEVTRNAPILLSAARRTAESGLGVRFAVACHREAHRVLIERLIPEEERRRIGLEIQVAKTPELLRSAEFAWAVSGSVSLELLVETLPSAIVYKVNRVDLWIARPFIKSKYICLVNLLAEAELMPEYLTSRDVSADLAAWAIGLLSDPVEMEACRSRLAALRDRVAVPGATDRAADRIAAIALESAERSAGTLKKEVAA